MFRHNRRQHVETRSWHTPVVVVLVVVFTLAIIVLMLDNRRSRVCRENRALEDRLVSLEAELHREQSLWTARKAPENIDQALLRHGLNMSLPGGEQIVRLSLSPAAPVGLPPERGAYADRR